MASGFSLKDQLFNAEKVAYLSALFAAASGDFDGEAFETRVMGRLPELELKARIAWIAECLDQALPGSLADVAGVVRDALPPPLDPTLKDDDFGDFIFAPVGDLVALKGLETAPDLSLDLLEEITQRFSMEWSIRPFLNRWPDLVLARMAEWVEHESYHVRRLVSEGTRPRLPWAANISLGVTEAMPLLDALHADPTRYVTRSVANHLNDISKKDADAVLAMLAAWKQAGRQDAKELDWMTRHALRTLVKQGHAGAMEALGYRPDAKVVVERFSCSPSVKRGEVAEIALELSAGTRTPVLIDYIIHFRKAKGELAPKVFKWKQAVIDGKPLALAKKHRFKADATTFTLHAGAHRIELQVNGRVIAGQDFELV